MADQAKENLNVEIGASWWAKEKTDYQQILEWANKNKLWDQEAAEAAAKAAKLLEEIQWTEWEDAKKEIIKKNFSWLPSDIKKEIQDFNRPEAKKWLEESYQTIQGDVDDMNKIWGNITSWIKKFFWFWPKKEKAQ